MTQLTILFKEDLTGQRELLFPAGVSANQELLEDLKLQRKWNPTEVEIILLDVKIEDEKERTVYS